MKIFKALWQKSMAVNLLLGIASGLPLLLTSKTLQAWMTDAKIDLKVIGLFSLVGLPYTVKFLWAPIFDRFTLPFLGRRRGWLLITQLCLTASLIALAFIGGSANALYIALIAFFVSFFSASQDIVIDAYRRESLTENEIGMGSTLYIYGYRVAMWITGGLALILADRMSWNIVYLIMASVMGLGIITTLWATEPALQERAPRTLRETVIDPLVEFFSRPSALAILAFILCYKLGDSMAGAMGTPFYLQLGFSKTEIGTIAKTFGFFSSLAGGFIGGAIMLRIGISRALWVFGILQMISVGSLISLVQVGHSVPLLTVLIIFEDAAAGMGTAAFTAFMASLTNKRFTATQYALLTSLMGVPRVILASPTGYLAKSFGWGPYFAFCTLLAIPGLLLLQKIAPWKKSA